MADRAIFLDKDGTLINNVPYNVDPALIELAPGVIKGLPGLRRAGYRLVLITNQSGVARGYFQEADLRTLFAGLNDHLYRQSRVRLDGFYFCPHHVDGTVKRYRVACNCRKPAPGLLLQAAREMNIDLKDSWFIGDILDDVEAGHRAGVQTVLIANGNETRWKGGLQRTPDYLVHDFEEAARVILTNDRKDERPTWAFSTKD